MGEVEEVGVLEVLGVLGVLGGGGGDGGGVQLTIYITSLLFLMAQHRTILKIIPRTITAATPIPMYPMM